MHPGRRPFRRLKQVGCVGVLGLVGSACSDATGTSDDLRPGSPYVTGQIVVRSADEWPKLLVERTEQRPAECGNTVSVAIAPYSDIRWSNGVAAAVDQLAVGQTVAVWNYGGELMSCTPQVTGFAITISGSPPTN